MKGLGVFPVKVEFVFAKSLCPACAKQAAGKVGAMHTKAQWKKFHPPAGKSTEPLITKK